MDGYSYLTFDQRREIEAMYGAGVRVVDIAAKTERSVAAIYEELKRGRTLEQFSSLDRAATDRKLPLFESGRTGGFRIRGGLPPCL